MWLVSQNEDIMDACLIHMTAPQLTALAMPFVQATTTQSRLSPYNTQIFAVRLAAQSHHKLCHAIAGGSLKSAILEGLEGKNAANYASKSWVRVAAWRERLMSKCDEMHKTLLRTDYLPYAGQAPKDNTAAILALGALDRASPQKTADFMACAPSEAAEQRRRAQQKAGYEALLYASSFSSGLQDTLTAHLIVGTALAFIGHTQQAETLIAAAVAHRLLQQKSQGPSQTFYGALRGHNSAPGRLSLPWLKAAALASGSAAIEQSYVDGMAQVGQEPIPVRCRLSLSAQWPHLS